MKLLVSPCAKVSLGSPLLFGNASKGRSRLANICSLKLVLALSLISFATAPVLGDRTFSADQLTQSLATIPEHSLTLIRGEPIASGNVVVRGEYVEPPYRITLAGRDVFINNEQITSLPEQPSANAATAGEFIARLERTLFWGSTLIVFDERTRLVVDSMAAEEFFASMLEAKTIEKKVQIVFEQADYDEFSKNFISTAQWRTALEKFPSTAAAVGECVQSECPEAGEYVVHTTDQSNVLNEKSRTAWTMYLLNSAGMLLAAISLGVLITNPPNANTTWIETLQSHSAVRLVKRCLSLTVVLSIFDLVSTITAESTGGFAEANPLAVFLMHDPATLTFAKLFGTCLTTGLLWSQRQYVGVQLASWWICFVLTLVTIRWVVVDSLFYV